MENIFERMKAEIMDNLRVLMAKVLDFIPDLLVMMIIVAAGFAAGLALRRIVTRLLRAVKFDAWSDSVGLTSTLNRAGITAPPAAFIGRFLFWLILITFFMVGFGSLRIEMTKALASLFFLYLPRFVSAVLIIIVGYILAGFLGRAALLSGVNAGLSYARLLGDAVRLLLLIFVFAMALEQLAIAPWTVFAGFSILFGAIALALALAFGLGGRDAAGRFIEDVRRKKEKDTIEPL